MEVVVVLDGPSPETREAIRSLEASFPLAVLEQHPSGAAAARNRGAERAGAPLVLFLDDDVEPLPGLVAAHVAAHSEGDRRIVMGPYRPEIPTTRRFHPIMIREWWASTFDRLGQPDHRFTYRDVLAGNLSMQTSLFRELGGFDPGFPSAGGEDWEFGIRLLLSGARFVYVPTAGARHHESSTPEKSFRRARLEGAGDVRIGSRHPWLRSSLPLARSRLGRIERTSKALAFRAPALAAALAAAAPLILRIFEALRWRRPWHRLGHRVRQNCYWRGVADVLPQASDLDRFLGEEPPPRAWREMELNLLPGPDAARRLLDIELPDGVKIFFGEQPLGAVAPVAGAEPLMGRHLDAIVETVGPALLAARMLSGDWQGSTRNGERSRAGGGASTP
jgi:GT2 family glycosyltransferase